MAWKGIIFAATAAVIRGAEACRLWMGWRDNGPGALAALHGTPLVCSSEPGLCRMSGHAIHGPPSPYPEAACLILSLPQG